ncbi:integral membrane protein [Niveomyces insectorum RCEF 264]|uniref:GDP-mannose transporter n=1 Tax=Niveomyces insectorum RCEF 264 TaxID=1081102 RepID=A0A167WTD3_9HYPO|nr:integral membrane protein [Niveomyces insectorum RCEF 264]
MASNYDRAEGSSATSATSASASAASAASFDKREEDEKLARLDQLRSEDSERTLKVPEEMEMGDEQESAELLPQASEKQEPPKSTMVGTLLWTGINTLATIGIVFTNKAIFSDPSLKLAQLTFAAFHFTITWFTLFILSRPKFAFFLPRRATIREILPLSVAMALNVILPNLSLAFSTVTFYQVARILLTPTVAAMNFILYRATLPRPALAALVPACLGVGMVSYYDSLPAANANVKTTSTLGIVFAFSGIFASSLYTVWIASYHRKLQMSSMQLLFNQAPVSAFLLLYAIPFADTFPVWSTVPLSRWAMILISGLFASLINISQFFIIAQTGPVSSTVVGHVKTCTIIGLGWATSGRSVGDKSILGVFIAVGGIMAYSYIMIKEKQKAAAAAKNGN